MSTRGSAGSVRSHHRCHHALSSVRGSIDGVPRESFPGGYHPRCVRGGGERAPRRHRRSRKRRRRHPEPLVPSTREPMPRPRRASHADIELDARHRCGPAIFRAGDPSPGIAVGASAAVSLDSSIELIVTYFAVLMAGKAFAPLETTLPPAALTGVLSALHEHANLTHHIVSARREETREEPDHSIRPGTRTLAIRLSKTKSHPGDDRRRAEPRLEVHESGVPVTVIRCADTSQMTARLRWRTRC